LSELQTIARTVGHDRSVHPGIPPAEPIGYLLHQPPQPLTGPVQILDEERALGIPAYQARSAPLQLLGQSLEFVRSHHVLQESRART